MHVVHRLRSEIADSRLDVEPAVGLDDEEPIEPDRATDVTAARYPNAARLRTAALRERFSLVPLEHLGPAVERFLEEGACGVSLLARDQRSEFRFALGRVDVPDGYLIDPQLPRSLSQQRLHQRDSLHASRRALRTAWRRIREDRDRAPAHGQRLIQQRNDAARRSGIAHLVVGTVIADHEHIERHDPAVPGKADLHTAVEAWTPAPDVLLFLAADAHHHRRIRLLGEECGNNQ